MWILICPFVVLSPAPALFPASPPRAETEELNNFKALFMQKILWTHGSVVLIKAAPFCGYERQQTLSKH